MSNLKSHQVIKVLQKITLQYLIIIQMKILTKIINKRKMIQKKIFINIQKNQDLILLIVLQIILKAIEIL